MSQEQVTFTLDSNAPQITIDQPVNGSFVATSTPSVAIRYQDAQGVDAATLKVTVDNILRTNVFIVSPSDASGTLPALSDGAHTISAEIKDATGNLGSTSSTFIIDTQAPVLTSDIPVGGRLVGASGLSADGRLTLTGTVTDVDPGTMVSCSTNGGVLNLASVISGSYSCQAPVTEGDNVIAITATDLTGHTASLSRSLTVDRVAPAITVSSPSNNTYVSGATIVVSGQVTDATAVTVTVNGQAAAVVPAGADVSTFDVSVNVGAGPMETIQVVATDAAGNTSTTSVTIRVDRLAPVVVITEPASAAYLRGGVTSVVVTVTDQSNTILDVNGVAGNSTGCLDAGSSLRRCTFTAEVPITSGSATITATAFDEAGNQGVGQVTATVDNDAPVILVTSPALGVVTNATFVSVSGTVSEASPFTLVVNGQTVMTDANGAFSATIATDVLGVSFGSIEGARTITFTATDAAGNESTTSIPITFDRTPPNLTIAAPLEGQILTNASVNVSGTVSDANPVTVTVQGNTATVNGVAYAATVNASNEGPLQITIRATDAAGNETTLTRNVEIDLAAPLVTITSPASGSLTKEATTTLTYGVLDRSYTTIKVNGVSVVDCPGVAACDRTQVIDLVDGDNTISVEATERVGSPSGYAAGRATSAQVMVTRDSIAPLIDLTAPDTASRTRPATASVTATDNNAVEHIEIRQTVQGATTVICTGTSSCSGAIVIPGTAVSGDAITLTAEASDRAGNTTTASRSVRVTADGVVTGTVLSDVTSLPLPGATVTLQGLGARSTVTDGSGRYNFPVADTNATVRIEKNGMTSVDRVMSVASGAGTVLLDARLTALAEVSVATPIVLGATAQDSTGLVSIAVPSGGNRITLLSPQGLPNLLPLGFSPLLAFDWRSEGSGGAAHASVHVPASYGVSLPEAVLVRYDPTLRDFRVVSSGLTASSGTIEVDLTGPATYVLTVPDSITPSLVIPAVGEALTGGAMSAIPATATSTSNVDPSVLPPTGGTATGTLRLDSPTSLPSGTVVQADVDESYTLASGEEASAPKRSVDILVYRALSLDTPSMTANPTCDATPVTPAQAGVHMCATFPITPSRTYTNTGLRDGRVHIDLLAGRESARGVVGGSAATSATSGAVRLDVGAGSTAEDTAITLISHDSYSTFVPTANGITPLGEVTIDFATAQLSASAMLTFNNVAASVGDTLVLARVDRASYDGIPRLQVVALADVTTSGPVGSEVLRATTRIDTGISGVTLEGVTKEGRYVLLRLSGPIGFATGTTTASGNAVRALVQVTSVTPGQAAWPFVSTSRPLGPALSGVEGYYVVPLPPGSAALTARVLGSSLIGTTQTTITASTASTANIALQGTVTPATMTPTNGAVNIEVNELFTLTSPVAINPTTVTPANITLRTAPLTAGGPTKNIPLRLVLSGSGKQLSIIPTRPTSTGGTGPEPVEGSLEFSTNYILEVAGLQDTVGGLITAPATTFRTKAFVKKVYSKDALRFSFPDAEGLVTVSAPNGSFAPGTEILIINSGNGVVLGLYAGNDGQVSGSLPASTSDVLLVTITDPSGDVTRYERSQYTDPATGRTAVGSGGGTIEGPQGSALEIPKGALTSGLALKLDVLTPEQYDTQFPGQRPAFGTRPIGSVLKVSADEARKFDKPAKLTLSVPPNFATTYPGADPRDATFYTLKRSVLADGAVTFETLDHAFAVCPEDQPGGGSPPDATCDVSALKVKTASPPFPEFTGNDTADVYIILTYDWAGAYEAARKPLSGVVVGRVRRQAWGTAEQAGHVSYVPVKDAKVWATDSAGNGLQPRANQVYATTQEDGTYTLWDSEYRGGTINVKALLGTESVTGVGFEGNPQDVSASWGPFPALRFYANKAHVDLLFESVRPPAPAPDVEVVLFQDVPARTVVRGLTTAGTPLRIGFKSNLTGEEVRLSSLDINGVNFTTTTDPQSQFSAITQDPWTPSQPGTYLLRATASAPIGGSVPVTATVRVVAAGGNVDTDSTQPPRVLEQRTYPKTNAKNVQTGIFPTIAFSEPVVGVTLQTVHLTRADIVPGPATGSPTDEAFKITGVTASGQVIDDVSMAPTLPITAITIQPLFGLKYKQLYTLSLTNGIQDLDTTAGSATPKSLVPYTTTFQTFGPESLPPDQDQAQSYTTTGFYVAKDQFGAAVSMWSLKHQIYGSSWITQLTGYDISDPVNAVEATSTSMIGRPMDLSGEGTTLAIATAPGARSIPSNVRLYDISDPQKPEFVGAASLANSAQQGTVSRINLRGNRIYAGTMRRGIQVVDVGALRSEFKPCCSVEHFRMQSDLSLDGQGFNQSAAFVTIPVQGSGSGSLPAVFTGIKSIAQGNDPVIVATGNFGLALAKESRPTSTFFTGSLTKDSFTVQYGLALDVANVGGYDLAVIAGVAGTKQVLMTVDVSNLSTPVVLGVREVITAGLGVVDVLVNGSIVYVSTQSQSTAAGAVEVFEISDPEHIVHLGSVNGVGGRLAIAGKLLYGATTTTFGALIDGFGGVRTAALEQLLLFARVDGPFQLKNGSTETDVAAQLRVFPPDLDIESVKFQRRVDDSVVAESTGTSMTYVVPRQTPLNIDSVHTLRATVNEGTPNQLFAPERRLRPVDVEFAGTLEADDSKKTDAIAVFDPRPFVNLNTVTPPSGPRPVIVLSGFVSDALAPISQVLIGNEVVSVTPTSTGPGGLGPYVGTFQTSVTLRSQEYYLTATAVNSLGNTGWDGVWLRPNVANDGSISSSETVPAWTVQNLSSVPAAPADGMQYAFTVEVKDRGLHGASFVTADLRLAAISQTLKLTPLANRYVSEKFYFVPETFQLPTGLPTAVGDAIKRTRIPASLGTKASLRYALDSIKDEGIATGIELVDATNHRLK